MTWLAWRQFRVQAVTVLAGVTALAIVLAVTGPRLARLARDNADVFDLLTRTDRNLFWAGVLLVAVAPAVIGADRKSTRLNSSHFVPSRMPSSA